MNEIVDNVLKGDPRSIAKLITNADRVRIIKRSNAILTLETDGTLGPYLVNNLRTFLEDVIAAGVELDRLIYSGDSNSFIFDDIAGSITTGKGFGDTTNPATGGSFVYIIL